jgi:hypothetical protein
MKRNCPLVHVGILFALLSAFNASADVVYVTALTSNCTSTTICGNGPNPSLNSMGTNVYLEPTAAGILGSFTSAISTAPGKPTEPGARFFSNTFSNSTPDAGVTIAPTLGVPGGVYQLHHVYSSAANNVSTTILMGMTNVDGCTLSDTNSDKFQRSFGVAVSGQNVWQFLGFVTNNSGISNPIIRFYRVEGAVSSGAQQRVLFDTFRFSLYQPCLDVAAVTVTGPLATNLPNVTVTGVSNAATQLTLYQDAGTGMTNVGTLAVSSPTATVEVPLSGVLLPGAQVAATQTIGGQEGCVPTSGTIVGSGANPAIRIAFSFRYDPNMSGPVGSPGTTAGNVYFLGASSVLAGSAPAQGAVLQPSTCWQTVTFTRGDVSAPIDPSVLWAGTGPAILEGNYGALDGLAIASEGDTGPIEIYLDALENGTNGLVQDFEEAAQGASAYQFSQPSFSGTTTPFILSSPNDSIVTNAQAYSGTNSLRARFQFNGTANSKWLRYVTAGNSGATVNPQFALNQPVTVRVLVLPVGSSTAHTFAGTVGSISNSPAISGGSTTLGVTTTGTLTYQWKFNGNEVTGETGRTYTLTSLSGANNGVYTVAVSDGTCTDTRSFYLIVGQQPPGLITINRYGTDIVLDWTGSFPLQSSIDVVGPYNDIGVTSGPYTNTDTSDTLFFRLRGN